MIGKKYYIDKKNKVKEMVFTNYDINNLYLLSPKRQKSDEIKVSDILITDSKMIEAIVKKKIEIKLDKYIKAISMLDEDDEGDWSAISQVLLDAERFRMKLINEYIKYLGRQYRSICIEKLGLIIEELRKMRSKAYKNYLSASDRGRRSR